jgi:hypothetical protein
MGSLGVRKPLAHQQVKPNSDTYPRTHIPPLSLLQIGLAELARHGIGDLQMRPLCLNMARAVSPDSTPKCDPQHRPAARSNGFQRQRDTLTSADAERDHAAADAIAPHRVQKPRREHGTGRTDRMTMRDGTTLHIDDVFGQT